MTIATKTIIRVSQPTNGVRENVTKWLDWHLGGKTKWQAG